MGDYVKMWIIIMEGKNKILHVTDLKKKKLKKFDEWWSIVGSNYEKCNLQEKVNICYGQIKLNFLYVTW